MTMSLIWCSRRHVPMLVANAVPLFGETRQSRGAVGTFVDITDRKRAGEALEATNAELRSFAYVLTRALQEPLRMCWTLRSYWHRTASDAWCRCRQASLSLRLCRFNHGGVLKGATSLLGG